MLSFWTATSGIPPSTALIPCLLPLPLPWRASHAWWQGRRAQAPLGSIVLRVPQQKQAQGMACQEYTGMSLGLRPLAMRPSAAQRFWDLPFLWHPSDP